MKLIDRFVSRELIVNVLFAILVLSLVLVVGNIFRKLLPLLVNHDVPLEYLLTFIAYVLPFSLIFTIPWGLLTAILLVFGRLSADNELIALRSNGVSVTRVCLPLLVLAIISTAICLWLTVMWRPPRKKNCGAQSLISQRAIRSPNRDWSLNAEGIYQHVSNANTSDRNVGLNALVGLLGFSRAF